MIVAIHSLSHHFVTVTIICVVLRLTLSVRIHKKVLNLSNFPDFSSIKGFFLLLLFYNFYQYLILYNVFTLNTLKSLFHFTQIVHVWIFFTLSLFDFFSSVFKDFFLIHKLCECTKLDAPDKTFYFYCFSLYHMPQSFI